MAAESPAEEGKSPAKPASEAGLIGIEQAAQLLMLSSMRLRQLAADGYCPKPVKGKVPLVGIVQGYVKFLRSENRENSQSASQSRVRDARAREIELRIAERDARLIDIEEHDSVLDLIVGGLRSNLLSLPQRVTRDRALRRTIEAELDGAFERTATLLSETSAQLRASGRAAEAGGAPDA